jgi:hypothetical protein
MRFVKGVVFASALAVAVPAVHLLAQGGAQGKQADEKDRAVAGGGITVPGWTGKIDAASAKQGRTINDSKFAQAGQDFHLEVGPAASYWNPKNVAKGDYTVKATFKNVKSEAGHPHSAGLFIAGQAMDTENPTYVYCVAYTDGSFLVRQFNGTPKPAQLAAKTANPAVKGPDASGGATNDIAWVVKGGKADCQINGTSVGSYDLATLKLSSLDGIYGIRVTHNMNLDVAGFGMTK